MTLRTKLFLAQLPLVVALLFLGILSIITTSRIGDSSQTILKDNYRSVLAVQKMKESLERMDSAAFFVIEERRQEAEDIFLDHRSRFEAELALQKSNITEKDEREATDSLTIPGGNIGQNRMNFSHCTAAQKKRPFISKSFIPCSNP